MQETLAPKPNKFKTTFPAPPGQSIILSCKITGTGNSGDILVEFPIVYLSNMKSPITKILIFEKSNFINHQLLFKKEFKYLFNNNYYLKKEFKYLLNNNYDLKII
jgi:hypothetical protein